MRKKKVILNREQVLQLLKEMKTNEILKDTRIGLTGSFARGKNKKSSDIDIVISYAAGENDIEITEFIWGYMTSNCDYKIDIMHLQSIIKSDLELNEYALLQGLPVIPEGIHERILREVIWIE